MVPTFKKKRKERFFFENRKLFLSYAKKVITRSSLKTLDVSKLSLIQKSGPFHIKLCTNDFYKTLLLFVGMMFTIFWELISPWFNARKNLLRMRRPLNSDNFEENNKNWISPGKTRIVSILWNIQPSNVVSSLLTNSCLWHMGTSTPGTRGYW